jgi:DNA-3-methyladenine glycosylase I
MAEHAHGAPPQIRPQRLADYLEVMSKAVFQSGISWAVIEKKWAGTREAFHGFDPGRLADLTPDDIDALLRDSRIIRNRRKVEGIVHNARALMDIEAGRGFRDYLRSFEDYEALASDMKRRFKFLGDMGVYYFLWVVSEPVPDYEEWRRRHGIREMPPRKR